MSPNFSTVFENLLDKDIRLGNKNRIWRAGEQLGAAKTVKYNIQRFKTLNLKIFCCIHFHTNF